MKNNVICSNMYAMLYAHLIYRVQDDSDDSRL